MRRAIKTRVSRLTAVALLCALPSVLLASEQQAPVLPATAQGWAELARQDIEAAYQITAENHPGMADKQNPGFQQQLLQAKTNALLLVTQVTDAYGYEAVIERFSTSLQDGHAGAYAQLPDSVPAIRRWPGFNTVWRGDALWVYYSEQAGVTAGMQVLSCDGKAVESLIKDRVFAFAGQANQPGHWWSFGSRLMLDDGNPFNPPLKQCQLVKPGAEAVAVTLNWQPRPESAMQHVKAAYNGDKLPVGLSWQQKDIAWIAMPTFSPEADDIKLYESLFSSLEQQRPRLLEAKAIVLDLRHNQGGSSYWSVQVANALWGEKRVESLRNALFSNTEVWWFASPGNTAYVKSLYDVLKTQGQTDMLPWIQAVGSGMQKSLDSGKAFYVEGDDSEADAASAQPEATQELQPLQAPVYVIMPGQCASACLDAVDVFTLFENTKLAGATSSADSTYMDVRFQILPSGLGQVIIPNKVYVNRPRANGQYYTPALAHNELDWSTQALLEKVLSDLKD
ncbi:S41 family peptidase [Rheinheimera sp. 1928-s]|uniref:S41 family peptidase n=1 Tax=Rheinheimera sp. 1928-s TaxID=3033803 RepID=UPI0026317B38|nr:S41 family peptidase [Rheinheimera sp. 1928-s]MDF3124883.1 S41 family peptidase [Rheinheimera sp. 1928-s]